MGFLMDIRADVDKYDGHPRSRRSRVGLSRWVQKALALLSFPALLSGNMPIIRLREPKSNQDKELPKTETRAPGRRPERAHLFARIAHLKHISSTKTLEDSSKLIENSRRAIFETELSLTRDDWHPSYRCPQWNDCNVSSVAPLPGNRMRGHRIVDSRDILILHEK